MAIALTLEAFSGALGHDWITWIGWINLLVAIAAIHILVLIIDVMAYNLPPVLSLRFSGFFDLFNVILDTLGAHALSIVHHVDDWIASRPSVGFDC